MAFEFGLLSRRACNHAQRRHLLVPIKDGTGSSGGAHHSWGVKWDSFNADAISGVESS